MAAEEVNLIPGVSIRWSIPSSSPLPPILNTGKSEEDPRRPALSPPYLTLPGDSIPPTHTMNKELGWQPASLGDPPVSEPRSTGIEA